MTALFTDELVKSLDEEAKWAVQQAAGAWPIDRTNAWQAARRLEALQAEVGRLRNPFRNVDAADWRHLFDHDLADSGHGQFWEAVLIEMRRALEGTQVERLSKPSSAPEPPKPSRAVTEEAALSEGE